MLLRCVDCGELGKPDGSTTVCHCSGLLTLHKEQVRFSLELLKNRKKNMWRYKEEFPFKQPATLDDYGYTSCVQLDHENEHILLKDEISLPTSTYLDRGSAILCAAVHSLGFDRIIINNQVGEALSIAAVAYKLGIQCEVWTKTSEVHQAERNALENYGANLFLKEGTPETITKAMKETAKREHGYYVDVETDPFFREGIKTYAYEIWEQLDGKVPDLLFLPINGVSLVLGVYEGFKTLKDEEIIEKLPTLIGIEEACEEMKENQSLKLLHIKKAIEATNGEIRKVRQGEIKQAQKALAVREFEGDLETAAAYAGCMRHYRDNALKDELAVLPLSRGGLKL